MQRVIFQKCWYCLQCAFRLSVAAIGLKCNKIINICESRPLYKCIFSMGGCCIILLIFIHWIKIASEVKVDFSEWDKFSFVLKLYSS